MYTCMRAYTPHITFHKQFTSSLSFAAPYVWQMLRAMLHGSGAQSGWQSSSKATSKKDVNDLDMSFKSVAQCCNGIELALFCLMRSAHAAGIHVFVCDVAGLIWFDQFIFELNCVRWSQSLAC